MVQTFCTIYIYNTGRIDTIKSVYIFQHDCQNFAGGDNGGRLSRTTAMLHNARPPDAGTQLHLSSLLSYILLSGNSITIIYTSPSLFLFGNEQIPPPFYNVYLPTTSNTPLFSLPSSSLQIGLIYDSTEAESPFWLQNICFWVQLCLWKNGIMWIWYIDMKGYYEVCKRSRSWRHSWGLA